METICIVCPNGCHLTVEKKGSAVLVTGNKCPKGEQYGIDEFTDPKRVVTAVVRTTSATWPCIPIKSSQPIARNRIDVVLKQLYSMQIDLPVKRGDVCSADCDGTGIALVYTRTLPPQPIREIT